MMTASRMFQRIASFLGVLSTRDELGNQADELSAEPPEDFDSHWYLSTYPDVAVSGMDPWQHYQRHGRLEGRLPRCNRAIGWDHALWRGADSIMQVRLLRLVESSDASSEEQQYARWALARWWAWQNNWAVLPDWLLPLLDIWPVFTSDTPRGPALLAIEACTRLSLHGEAGSNGVASTQYSNVLHQAINMLSQYASEHADLYLARSCLALAEGANDPERLAPLNAMWADQGLSTVVKKSRHLPLTMDNLAPEGGAVQGVNISQTPKVSVVVPVFNAESSVATALRSLFVQRFEGATLPFEIIVVDDASEDASLAAVEALRDECPEHVALRIIHHKVNQGAYAARNTGLAAALGELVTTHDSDDWSHPDKLRLQIDALHHVTSAEASLSWWVRATPALLFHRWRLDSEGWVYPNLSSLMVRRAALDKLGFWDNVKVNADSEFRERLAAIFGNNAVCEVLPGVPLSIGRAEAGSLSQSSQTHLITQFIGVRRDYMASARRWHQSVSPEALFLPQHPTQRPFEAPSLICRPSSGSSQQAVYHHPQDTFQAAQYASTAWFDPAWYLRTYIDLQQVLIDPLEHYWLEGEAQGRDPGPHFSVSGYRYLYAEKMRGEANGLSSPLLHFLHIGLRRGYSPRPVIKGNCVLNEELSTVMVSGHAAGERLYGAERSLLDLVKGLRGIGLNVVVSLPVALNRPYMESLLEASLAVAVLPYGWWQKGKQPESATCKYFCQLMQQFKVSALHANTLVLDEPIHAARALGIPTIMHVRELPEHDSALRDTLNATGPELMQRVRELADIPVAISRCVAEAIASEQTLIVPNTIDMPPLLEMPLRETNDAVRLGMLSSNLAKKGLADIAVLVKVLAEQSVGPLEIWLFGPSTPDLARLLRDHDEALTGIRIIDAGYVTSPVYALAQLDIVMNISHFQESFGRTVLEAMAAGRPVVCYDWGALSELVLKDTSGYLVPLGDIETLAYKLAALVESPELRYAMGQAGRQFACEHFGSTAYLKALSEVYDIALKSY